MAKGAGAGQAAIHRGLVPTPPRAPSKATEQAAAPMFQVTAVRLAIPASQITGPRGAIPTLTRARMERGSPRLTIGDKTPRSTLQHHRLESRRGICIGHHGRDVEEVP